MNNEAVNMFDTLAYVNRLKAVGVPNDQAQVQAEVMAEALNLNNRLATKESIKNLERDIRKDMYSMEQGIRKDRRNMEQGIRKDMQSMEQGIRKDMQSMEQGIRKDMQSMEQGIRKDMQSMEKGIRGDMRLLENKLTIKLGGLLLTGLTILITLMKVFQL